MKLVRVVTLVTFLVAGILQATAQQQTTQLTDPPDIICDIVGTC